MSFDLLDQERAITEHLALGRFESDYLHRATRETALDHLHSRSALREDTLADLARWRDQRVTDGCALPDMVAVTCEAHDTAGATVTLRRHRWVRWEGERIAAETLVCDTAQALGAALVPQAELHAATRAAHPAYGELTSGMGQRSAGAEALLAAPAPAIAKPLLDALHRLWNGGALDTADTFYMGAPDWRGPAGAHGDARAAQAFLRDLLADLPDAVWIADRVSVAEARVAVLWRLFAHHVRPSFGLAPTGRRVRLIGSSVFTLAEGRVAAEDTVLDLFALHVQLRERTIAL